MQSTLPPLRPLLRNLRSPWVWPILLATLTIPLIIYKAPKSLTGAWDLQLPFGLFLTQTLLGLVLLGALAKDLRAFVTPLLPKAPLGLAGLVFLGITTWMAVSWIEPRHRVQSDESIYLAAAQNLYHQQSAGACDEGIFVDGSMDCLRKANNFKAKGLSWLMTLGMPIFGSELGWIFPAHMVLFAFTGLAFFLALVAWLRNPYIAMISTALLLAQPTVLFQFRSMSVEPLYIFLSALSLFQLRWAWERNTPRHWLLLALTLAFFAQTRQETVFCIFAFAFVAALRTLEKPDIRFPSFFLVLALFSTPVLFTISHYQGYGFQGGEYAAHGHFLTHLKINWGVMTQTAMKDGLLWNPFLSYFSWLALFGAVTLLGTAFFRVEARRHLLFLALYHLQTYMIFENSSGDFTIEINQRYSLVILPTLAYLGGLFLHELFFKLLPQMLDIKQAMQRPAMQHGVAWASLAIIIALTARHEDSFRANIMYNRNHLTMEQAAILTWQEAGNGKNALFVYARPWHFTGYGQSAIHYDRLRNAPEVEIQQWLERFDGEVIYIRGMDCWDSRTYHRKAVENRIPGVCDHFENRFELETLHKTTITNNYVLHFAKVKGIKGFNTRNLLQMGVFQYLPPPVDQLLVSYALTDSLPRPWSLRISLNDSVLAQTPYRWIEALDTFPKPPMIPGYNQLILDLVDSAGKSLLRKEDSRFFSLGKAVSLTSIAPTHASQGWGQLQKNRSVMGNPLTVNGTVYNEGFGTHSYSRLMFPVGGQFKTFAASGGLDDEDLGGDGVQFRILGDGKLLHSSPVVPILSTHRMQVDITGVQTLVLEVDSVANTLFDHANWLNPVLLRP